MHLIYFHCAFSQMNIWKMARKRNKCSLSIVSQRWRCSNFFILKIDWVLRCHFFYLLCAEVILISGIHGHIVDVSLYIRCVSLQRCEVLMIMQSIYCPHTSVSVSYTFVRTRVRNNNNSKNKHWAAFGVHIIRELYIVGRWIYFRKSAAKRNTRRQQNFEKDCVSCFVQPEAE